MSDRAPNSQSKSRQRERSAKPSAPPSHSRQSSRSAVDAQGQQNFQRIILDMESDVRRRMNAQALPHLQGEAPRYPDPTLHHPSNSQGQPAQQEHFNEGRNRGQPSQRSWRHEDASETSSSRSRLSRPQPGSGSESFSPLEATNLQQENVYPSGTRQLSQVMLNDMAQLNVTSNSRIGSEASEHPRDSYHPETLPDGGATRPHTRPRTTEQARQIPIEKFRPTRERDQKQAGSSKSSVSDAQGSGLTGGVGSRGSSQSSPPRKDRISSSSKIELPKSDKPWKYSLLSEWNPKSRGKTQLGGLLDTAMKGAGYTATPSGIQRNRKSESNNNLKGRGDRKSNHRSGYRNGHDNRSSEQFDDESVEGLSSPGSFRKFDTRHSSPARR
ncbi:hypothetical protein EAE96_002813 [Botrytis aclada]|nr:hypothetical protein EAE96_002813 [Botrytis aclada]